MGKGQLLFKGDKRPKKKNKKSKAEKKSRGVVPDNNEEHEASTASALPTKVTTTTVPSIQTGTGKITTSGTVVTGHSTKFQKELGVGDAVLVGDEMRVVTMRLSDTSVNLSSAFSKNLREPTKFRFVNKPKNQPDDQQKQQQQHKHKMEQADALEKNAFDIYGSGSTSSNVSVFTYREKTETGSYRVKKQAVSSSSPSSSSTRTNLLALRSKKSSDKYC